MPGLNTLAGLTPESSDRWAYERLMQRQQLPQQSYGTAATQPVVPPPQAAPSTAPNPFPAAQTSYVPGQGPTVPTPTAPPPSSVPPVAPPSDRVPGQEDYGFGRNADGTPALGANGQPALPPSTNPVPGATSMSPKKVSHAYPGSALDYYGTGDIEGSEDVVGGSHASTGVNTGGWETGERGSRSIKNISMRIATRYPPKPSSLDLWLADEDTKRFFPNAKKVGFDKIDFGDGKPVDMIKNADPVTDTGEAWAFQPESTVVPKTAGQGQAAWKASQSQAPAPPTGAPAGVGVPSTGIDPAARALLRRETRQSRLADLA